MKYHRSEMAAACREIKIELGRGEVEGVFSVHDLHATILERLGIDHHRLTYKFQGLDFKLTGVDKADVVKAILS